MILLGYYPDYNALSSHPSFFYVTKKGWLDWFNKSKDNTIDHRSNAEVVCTKNIGLPISPSNEKSV